MTKYDMNQLKGIYTKYGHRNYLLYDIMSDMVPHIIKTKYLLIGGDIMKVIKVFDTDSYPIIHKYHIERSSYEIY